ncbi:OmpA family protein [Actinomyces denticolens]|uniref:OmpA family protein n=1 Tax=Actinomyces denticolens TaxID=52767 RepID=UPI0015B55D37|nr:OmpA family protein [Actinomyces denticolens]
MPILSRRSLLSVPVLVAVGVPVVAACSGEGSSGEGGATVASVSAPAGWQSLSGSVMGHSVTVDVGPLVRMDESTTLLPLRVTRAADDPDAEGLDLRDVWSHYEVKPSLTALRVIDVEGSRVWDPLNSNDSSMPVEVGQSVLCAGVFGAVDVGRVTAMLPMVGSPAVEVLERADAEATLGADVDLDQLLADAAIDLFGRYHKSGLDEAREPVGVESFTRVLDGSAASRTTTTSITTILSSDVTFEFGKYDLTAQADGQLQAVAGQIASYGGGELSVVGHTDDVSDDAFNQTLSEQRAAAVRKRLGELTDLSAWSVTEEGRGKTEPAVEGTDEAARAANRRVVVTITPTGGAPRPSRACLPRRARRRLRRRGRFLRPRGRWVPGPRVWWSPGVRGRRRSPWTRWCAGASTCSGR